MDECSHASVIFKCSVWNDGERGEKNGKWVGLLTKEEGRGGSKEGG